MFSGSSAASLGPLRFGPDKLPEHCIQYQHKPISALPSLSCDLTYTITLGRCISKTYEPYTRRMGAQAKNIRQ
ncbi:hypothetical protein NDU88_003343 [Pleurodeles waltl]|uniref:Uncharacterized protein n=1 Tax=Pleurodeles waltl TaxID=8319 RepID=A0AAV7NJ36_PLEWA|nr:hypothetical protein NDU88_003343 [Pleurodeles waltl]